MPFINDEIISSDLVAVKAKIEGVYNVAEALTSADGVMLSNFKLTPIKATHEDSGIVSGTSGNTKKSLNFIMSEASFDIELGRAVGAVVTVPPAVGMFLRVCGWDEYIEVDHVRYQLASDINQQDSLTFETQIDDRNIKLAGVRGDSTVMFNEDKRLMASFKVEANFSEPTQSVFARVDYSAFARSLIVNPDNVTACTQKGSDVVTHSIEFSAGANVARIPSVNQKMVAHTSITPSCKSTIRAPKLAQWNIEADVANETEDWIKFALGSAAGAIVEMDIYQQYLNVDYTDETPKKANITHHPIPDATTSGAVIRFL